MSNTPRRHLLLGAGAALTSYASQAVAASGTVVRVEARPSSGFNWPYLLWLPPSGNVDLRMILIGPNNAISEDVAAIEAASREVLEYAGPLLAAVLRAGIVLPLLPRPRTDDDAGTLYTHALSRAALLTSRPDFHRIDLQSIAMLDDAVRRLRTTEPPRRVRTAIWGFSASGRFAQRMSILHPQRFEACVAGGIAGLPTLPLRRWRGSTLNYPLGVADLKRITGRSFDLTAFRQVATMLVQGAEDRNDPVSFRDNFSTSDERIISAAFGPIDQRLQRVREAFLAAGVRRFEDRLYPGVGHSVTRRLLQDSVQWISAHWAA